MVLRSTNASILLMFGIFVMRVGLRLLLGFTRSGRVETQDASCILREVPLTLVELGRQNPFLKPLDPDPCHIGEKARGRATIVQCLTQNLLLASPELSMFPYL